MSPPSWDQRLQSNKIVEVIDPEEAARLQDICVLIQRAPHMCLSTLSITSTRELAVALLEGLLPNTHDRMHVRFDNTVCTAVRLGELDAACQYDIVIMVGACDIPSKLTFAGYLRIAHIVRSASHVVLVTDGGASNVSFYRNLDNPQFRAGRVYEV